MLRCELDGGIGKTPQRFFSDSYPRRPADDCRCASHPARTRSDFQFRHIPELDGFRGAAISLVVLGHFLEFHSASEEVRYVGRNAAQLGVLLFFVLSGFLITGLSVARERKFGKQAGIGLVCPRKRSRNSNACKTCHLALH